MDDSTIVIKLSSIKELLLTTVIVSYEACQKEQPLEDCKHRIMDAVLKSINPLSEDQVDLMLGRKND